jgi:hypothetical protein
VVGRRTSTGALGDDGWLLPTHEESPFRGFLFGSTKGADGETRTPDPFITSEVLYQLSYVGGSGEL